jgi:HAE1 family hydrophobic/amphiphilic exporter-1
MENPGQLSVEINMDGGSGQNAPIALAGIGGLISSTLLTLVVVPVLVSLTDGLGLWIAQFTPKSPEDEPGGQ